MTRDEIAAIDPEIQFLTGFDDALLGVSYADPKRPMIAVYSYSKIIEAIGESMVADAIRSGEHVEDLDLDEIADAATDHFSYDILGALTDVRSPLVLMDD